MAARKSNLIINDEILLAKAKEIGPLLLVNESIKYSTGWLKRFKRRFWIKRFTLRGESASNNDIDVENEGRKNTD